MKRHFQSLEIAVLTGALALGIGFGASLTSGAQQPPPARQQPMEIPAQYPPQQPYPGGPGQQGPQGPQGQPDGWQQGDPGAARLSFIRGDVSTQHSDSSEWAAATLNTPVVPGDHVSTGQDSRAEIQLDNANILRMADDSTVNVVSLSPTQMQLQIGQGLVNFDVLKNSEAEVEIQTPNVAIHPLTGEGSFRILVNSDGETIVDVRSGSAEISTPQGSTRVERDQRITVQGNADNAQYQVSGAPGRDEWDRWNNDRDHSIETAQSWQHTNPYYTGSQDLDANGQWNNVPDYGSVWFPNEDAGWAPYRDGRWVYEPYYGWTWVSYEPWGWAPYHYGRWFVYGGNWGWWPGPVYAGYRPLWAPAYVSFFGFGGGGWGVNVGFGFGGFNNVGWLPCGPGDRFFPWYGRGVNRVNVVNIYDIHNQRGGFAPLRGGSREFSNVERAFNDDRVRGGISSMRGDQFGRGRVPTQQQRIDAGSFRQASMIAGGNPVSPSRDSYRPSDRRVNPGAIPNRAANNQRFFGGTSRPETIGQSGRGAGSFSRGENSAGTQQQNSGRPEFRSFGSTTSGNNNSRARHGGFNDGGYQVQQNSGRPSTEQSGQAQRGSVDTSPRQGPSNQSFGSIWRRDAAPSGQAESNGRGRSFEGQGEAQPRSNYSQPPEPSRQLQSNPRSNYDTSGYSRPRLNMQQPVVTPRTSREYSAPHAVPNGSGNGGYRGAPPSGGYSGASRGSYSGGGNRGGSSPSHSSGSHGSSSHSHR